MAFKQNTLHILFLLPDFPYPASTGGRLKVFNELLFLSELHQCDILCFGRPTENQKNNFLEVLPKVNILDSLELNSGVIKWLKMVSFILRALPPSFATFWSKKYVLLVREYLLTGNYDVVHYDIVNMAQYISEGISLPSVHSPNDATSLAHFRVAKKMPWSISKIWILISAKLLQRFERRAYPLFSKVHVVSEIDAKYLKSLNSLIDTCVIPITLQDDFLVKISTSNKKTAADSLKIICTGNLGNPAIALGVVNFLQIAFPLILQSFPNTQFIILGQNIKRGIIKKIKNNARVKYFSWVEDYRKFLAEADVVLVPDCSGPPGAKTRVLLAMGLGLPIVGSETAFDGIPLKNGKHALVYNNSLECADLIIKLFKNKKMRIKLSENAHLLVKSFFALNTIGPNYESLYHDAIIKHKSTVIS